MSDQELSHEPEEAVDFAGFAEEGVESFAHLGSISDEFSFAGHSYGLRTLLTSEEIAAAKAIESFRNTIKEPEAWASAQVALALTHIDGDEDFCPRVAKDQVAYARARFNFLTGDYHWIIIEEMYRDYTVLLQRQTEKVREAQDLSNGSLLTFWPSEDSFNPPGTLSDETNTESPSIPS